MAAGKLYKEEIFVSGQISKRKYMTKLSIVIPIYNAERWLKDCIDSILTQDYQDYEITFSKPVSFDALYICMKNWANKNNWSYNYSFAFKDVQIK